MSWWFMAFRGAVALVLGLTVLVVSWGMSYLATFLAFYFVFAGLAALRSATGELGRGRGRRLRRGAGMIAIVVAVGVLTRQLVWQVGPDWVIAVVLGIGSIAVGGVRLAGGFLGEDESLERTRARRRLPASEIALGVAEILLGAALLTADAEWVQPAVAVWGIVAGVALFHDAARRRSAAPTPRPE